MNSTTKKRIGILTGGGDCPGLNAVIRAATKTAWAQYGATVVGIEDGFEGLVEGRMHEIQDHEVSNILSLGGTILGSSNKGDPWHYPVEVAGGRVEIQDCSFKAIRNVERWALDAVIAIGGDGTMNICSKLLDHGVNMVGVPKTIDNDLAATDMTFGFDTAVSVVCEAIDRLHTTASSHHRVMVIEVMGRHAGWIALVGGAAGGADVILLPEIPFSWQEIFRVVKQRNTQRKRFSIVCVAEGAKLPDGEQVIKALDHKRTDAKQLGGIGAVVAEMIEEGTGLETRVTVLGHLQRGGSPTAFDRILATNFGAAAAHAACRGDYGQMAALRNNSVITVPIKEAIAQLRTVPRDNQLVQNVQAIGVSFGCEAGQIAPLTTGGA
ncbi:MAG TPA: ATP-dependent 6-phosphofructokinase [Accumulibacter sp.]|nr:ATP-dependent 6-phosphofructokinase [Accumulibacter sp.]HMW16574.1 ATP-dependent 6-phosphofructokinase [Accumulibacter sp.]HMX22737.1 ATP-dependent 6-phosphofructokinase [Accumulibacter sp.]HMY07597.1 ATP-dependent 6-phosphofructokinase [Accumulibacter sp.]HNC18192.1 ATP-dependent 6-phosphofructokinase [Accumulibacter sp.]